MAAPICTKQHTCTKQEQAWKGFLFLLSTHVAELHKHELAAILAVLSELRSITNIVFRLELRDVVRLGTMLHCSCPHTGFVLLRTNPAFGGESYHTTSLGNCRGIRIH